MSIRQQIRATLRGGQRYACGFCGLRFENEREGCPACGGAVTERR